MKNFIKCENGNYINLDQVRMLEAHASGKIFAEEQEYCYEVRTFESQSDAQLWLDNLMIERAINR